MRKPAGVAFAAFMSATLSMAVSHPLAQSAATVGPVPAPDPNIPVYFEAASIKLSDPAAPG